MKGKMTLRVRVVKRRNLIHSASDPDKYRSLNNQRVSQEVRGRSRE